MAQPCVGHEATCGRLHQFRMYGRVFGGPPRCSRSASRQMRPARSATTASAIGTPAAWQALGKGNRRALPWSCWAGSNRLRSERRCATAASEDRCRSLDMYNVFISARAWPRPIPRRCATPTVVDLVTCARMRGMCDDGMWVVTPRREPRGISPSPAMTSRAVLYPTGSIRAAAVSVSAERARPSNGVSAAAMTPQRCA